MLLKWIRKRRLVQINKELKLINDYFDAGRPVTTGFIQTQEFLAGLCGRRNDIERIITRLKQQTLKEL
jgi:hypothetical protein